MPRVRCVCLLIDILAPLDPLRKNMAAVRPENGEFLQRVEECEKGGKYSYYARAKGETGEENGNERSTEIRLAYPRSESKQIIYFTKLFKHANDNTSFDRDGTPVIMVYQDTILTLK
uniref:Uncharacterized protein n=1 Tax=Vespula pensylvanica TaxID=30213 RepID=A0A834U574_VESPE|nr:hypothetical protein H0235_011459 [Vespula pensylvanica]